MLIRNAQEEPHADKQITVDVSLFSDDNGSFLFYKERHTLITDFMGVASMVIGEGTLISGNLSISPRFLKMEVDPEGGSNFSINFSEKLSSVPFSQFSEISLKIPPKSVEAVNIGQGIIPLNKLGFPYATIDNLNLIGQSLTTAGNKNYHIKSNGTCTFGSVTDKEGNTYKTITIGAQEWMAENLRSGGGFPQVSSSSDWSNLQQPAWSYYDNNPTNNNSFGKLYNGFAVNQYKNLCPTGWHIPNDFEWSILSKTLGGDNVSGGALKSINSTFWVNPNVGATNTSCFSSIPNGYRQSDGTFNGKGSSAVYFQSDFSGLPHFRLLNSKDNKSARLPLSTLIPKVGAAVRCLKGDSVGIYSPLVNLDSISQISPNSSRVYANVQDGGSQVLETGIVWSTIGIPSISGNKLSTYSAKSGSTVLSLTSLTPNTKYYVRAFAINKIGISYSSLDSFITSKVCLTPTISDIDGNVYNTIAIGNQCWTKENLRVTKYNDGTLIPLDNSGGTSGSSTGQTWGSRTAGARTIYAHSQANLSSYGYLYNWYAAKGIATSGYTSYKNLCPTGWHVPSDGEWTTLTTHLGGENVAGGKMKSTGTTLWRSPNSGATNESGFSGLPGGFRIGDGSFGVIRIFAFFWSASEDFFDAWIRYLASNDGDVIRSYDLKSVGASVRCLRD
ncbi:MAG: fibrobacter succinogenes major paralogous domain-containing protein [Saprospiraceae bacterium]